MPGLQKDAALHMQREKQVSDRVTKKNLYHYNKNLFSGLDITCENVRLSQLETVIRILKNIIKDVTRCSGKKIYFLALSLKTFIFMAICYFYSLRFVKHC